MRLSKLKKRLKGFLCVGLSLCMLFAGALSASAESLTELRERQDSLQEQKEENDALLEKLQADTEQKKAYRDVLYEQIDTVQSQLDLLRKQIGELDLEIAAAEDKIAEKQTEIDRNMDLLKERIKALYVTGDASTLALILNSTDLMDFTEKSQFLRAVTRHDQELIDKLTSQLQEIDGELSSLNANKSELSQDKKELDSKGAELTLLYEKAQQLVEEAENEELNALINSEILGAQMEENEEAIAQLEEEIRRQQISGGWSAGGSGYVGSGSFIWPMPGYTYLTCYFGEGGHRGIDIAGGDIYGKPIVAADGGTVIYAGWNDSYGYCVFIDHGNGYETRYAHMSALGTDTGAAVDQGQVIGYVGSTGNSTGPHLHFEVIYGGSLTNPMGYF